MKYIRKLPDVEELKAEFSLTEAAKNIRCNTIKELQDVLQGKSLKKIICIGPCSADREDAVLEYMYKLSCIKRNVADKLLIIPRIYTSKPRTKGIGYKGLLHMPNPADEMGDVYTGIIATRKMHLDIIKETGMFGVDEMLYPEIQAYISDLLVYTAVGARSVENQQHRLVASGLDMPVGMKNPTSGNLKVMLNAIYAAQTPQSLMYRGWECRTKGNEYAHAILRGYVDLAGENQPNYHYENLCKIYDSFVHEKIANPSVIIDCNHSNSNKHYDEQIRISEEIFTLCRKNVLINQLVKGLMIESYLLDGCQMIGEGFYGKSITDPCLGWEKTEYLIYRLYEMLG